MLSLSKLPLVPSRRFARALALALVVLVLTRLALAAPGLIDRATLAWSSDPDRRGHAVERLSDPELLLHLIEDEPEDQWLMGGVERIEFWFHDGSAWRTTWDSTSETTPLPRGVRMDLELTPQPDQQYDQPVISVVVPLLVQASTNTSSQANQSASGTGGSGGS